MQIVESRYNVYWWHYYCFWMPVHFPTERRHCLQSGKTCV